MDGLAPQARGAGAWLTVAAYSLVVALAANAVAFWGRGIIDREAVGFVLHYTAPRPLLAKIFDPNTNDGGFYQARELSYLVDSLDAQVFAALVERGILVFVPASGVIGLLAVSSIYLWGARRVVGLEHRTAALLLALFLSTIVVQASTPIFYRSSKILLSAALLAFLFHATSLLQRDEPAPYRSFAALSLVGVAMPAFDRQGFFFLLVTTATITALWLVASRRANYAGVVAASGCAIAAASLYDYVIGPAAIHWANGYWPDSSFQQLAVGDLLRQRPVLERAWLMFRAQVSYFFGNAPFTLVAVGAVAAGAVAAWQGRPVEVLVIASSSAASLVLMLALMILRHPPVYFLVDHALRYYTLTMHAALLFGVTLLAGRLGATRGSWVTVPLLVAMIAGNVAHHAEQRALMMHRPGYLQRQYGMSQKYANDFAADRSDDRWPPAWLRP